jgi:hypothetical protein
VSPVWQIFREVISSAEDERRVPLRPPVPAAPTQGTPMSDQPQLSAQDLLEQLRGQFEKLCSDVAAAVNAAPAGQVINASEEKVRDLLADFRLSTYQTALQLRLDAAQAAFPPSGASDDGQAPAEQGPQ